MGFVGEGCTAVIGNGHVVSAVDRVARRALYHPVGGNTGKHKMSDTLGAENCFQGTGIEGTHPGFRDHDITRVTLHVRMAFRAPGAVFESLVLLHSNQDWRVLRRVDVIRAIGMADMYNRHSHLASGFSQARDSAEHVVLLY